MAQTGLKITNRYSPGYCGWVTSEQHKLFALLPKDICSIRLTESSLMLPIKSVSGFIGIGPNVRFNPYTCQLCEAPTASTATKNPKSPPNCSLFIVHCSLFIIHYYGHITKTTLLPLQSFQRPEKQRKIPFDEPDFIIGHRSYQ